jgi:hypothetical protein
VVATTGIVLLVPLARIEDVARVIVVADAVMDGWGLLPRFLLVRVDRSIVLAWHRWCGLVEREPMSLRHGAFGLLHYSTLEEGT